MVLLILAAMTSALVPKLLAYQKDARVSRACEELASFRLVAEVFAAGPGNGRYPRCSNDPSDPHSVASVLRERGVAWGGPGGARDPWGAPYRYFTAPLAPVPYYPLSYAFQSAGPDGEFGTEDDVWCTDWEPPRQGDPSGQWFASGEYPCVESAESAQLLSGN